MQVAKDQNPFRRAFDWLRPEVCRQGAPVGALRAALTIHPSETLPFANSVGRFAMCSVAGCLAVMVPVASANAANDAASFTLPIEDGFYVPDSANCKSPSYGGDYHRDARRRFRQS